MFTDVSGNSEENDLEGKRLEQRKKEEVRNVYNCSDKKC